MTPWPSPFTSRSPPRLAEGFEVRASRSGSPYEVEGLPSGSVEGEAIAVVDVVTARWNLELEGFDVEPDVMLFGAELTATLAALPLRARRELRRYATAQVRETAGLALANWFVHA